MAREEEKNEIKSREQQGNIECLRAAVKGY
jgi:hypothetical protein